MTREEVRLDILTPFRVLSGYATIEGDVTLLILEGGVWPGLAALPPWMDDLIQPNAVRIVGQVSHEVPRALFELAVVGLVTQALDRAPSPKAVAALPQALGRTHPPSTVEVARLLHVSRDTAARQIGGKSRLRRSP